MFFTPKKMSPEILRVCSLSSTLSVEDQIKFLDILISTKDSKDKKKLISRALIGERVWEEKQVI